MPEKKERKTEQLSLVGEGRTVFAVSAPALTRERVRVQWRGACLAQGSNESADSNVGKAHLPQESERVTEGLDRLLHPSMALIRLNTASQSIEMALGFLMAVPPRPPLPPSMSPSICLPFYSPSSSLDCSTTTSIKHCRSNFARTACLSYLPRWSPAG